MYSERKPKISFSALDIIGMIFAPMGLIFMVIGAAATAFAQQHPENTQGNPMLFLLVFGGIGAVFLLLGVVFLALMFRRNAIQKAILAEGHHVMATVTGIMPNYNIRVNGRSPYVAECSYTDPDTGVVHLFRSRNIYFDPTSILMDAQVAVYLRPHDYRHYYVDVDAVLPEIEKH